MSKDSQQWETPVARKVQDKEVSGMPVKREESQGIESTEVKTRMPQRVLQEKQNLMTRAGMSFGRSSEKKRRAGKEQPWKEREVQAKAMEYIKETRSWYVTWVKYRKQQNNPPRNRDNEFRRSENPVGAIIQSAKAYGYAVVQKDKQQEKKMLRELLKAGEGYARARMERRQRETEENRRKQVGPADLRRQQPRKSVSPQQRGPVATQSRNTAPPPAQATAGDRNESQGR